MNPVDAEIAERPLALLIAPYFYPAFTGGAVQVYDGLARRLRRVRLMILTDSQDSSPAELAAFDRACLEERGYEVRRLPRLRFHMNPRSVAWNAIDAAAFFWSTRRDFRALLADCRPSVVLCGGVFAAGWLMRGVPRGVARANYIHGEEITQVTGSGPINRFLRRERQRAIEEADANIVVSRFTRDVVAGCGVPPARIHVLQNCVDSERFSDTSDRAAGRRRFGLGDETVVLTVARLVPRKGVDRVMEALRALRDGSRPLPNWLYVVAGTGPEEANLRALAIELGLENHVRFLGFVPDADLPSLYRAADLFVLANREVKGDTEGFGLVFLEANAAGLAVIGGRSGGAGDAIVDGVTGLQVDSEDLASLAGALERLLRDVSLRTQMARAGQERVRTDFRWAEGAARFEALVLSLLGDRGRGDP
jgi:phosphatidylinositol alpha-1,6-mannosyltransferase